MFAWNKELVQTVPTGAKKEVAISKLHSLLVYFPSYLSLETTKWPFMRSSSQAATCYYQFNHSKEEVIPLSTLSKDTTSELSGLSSLSLFLCWTSSREAVNINFQSILIWLGQGIERRSTDYEANL